MTTGVLLLAAGRSVRFGSDKRLARFGNRGTLLEASVDAATASGLPLQVALRADDAVLAAALAAREVTAIHCETSMAGMGHTLSEAASALPGSWSGVLVALGDMPLIRPATFVELAGRLRRDTIVVPVCAGRRGHPVGFGADFFTALRGLSGDHGARELVTSHRRSVVTVAVDDAGTLLDVDHPGDCDPARLAPGR